MSTVGFGDYSPRSNEERVIGSMLLLLGVAIFSYILGVFLDLVSSFQQIINPKRDDSKLAQFFSTLQKYNHNKPIST